jgi:hypothetical protein
MSGNPSYQEARSIPKTERRPEHVPNTIEEYFLRFTVSYNPRGFPEVSNQFRCGGKSHVISISVSRRCNCLCFDTSGAAVQSALSTSLATASTSVTTRSMSELVVRWFTTQARRQNRDCRVAFER